MAADVSEISTTDVDGGPTGAAWVKACNALKGELGEDTFGSWIAPAKLKRGRGGRATRSSATRGAGVANCGLRPTLSTAVSTSRPVWSAKAAKAAGPPPRAPVRSPSCLRRPPSPGRRLGR